MPKVSRTRRFLKIFLPLLLTIVVILLAIKGIRGFLYNNPIFRIARLELSQAYPLDNRIKKSIQGKNIFKINLKELSQKIIRQHPEMLRAEIKRLFPDKVVIELEMRLPFARIESRAPPYKTFLVDQEGFILPRTISAPANQLPLIVGINTDLVRIRPGKHSESIQLARALALFKEILSRQATAEYRVNKLDVTNYKNISFFINEEIEVKIGAGDFERRLTLLGRTFSELKANDYQPKYIDLRFGDPIIGTR